MLISHIAGRGSVMMPEPFSWENFLSRRKAKEALTFQCLRGAIKVRRESHANKVAHIVSRETYQGMYPMAWERGSLKRHILKHFTDSFL